MEDIIIEKPMRKPEDFLRDDEEKVQERESLLLKSEDQKRNINSFITDYSKQSDNKYRRFT